MPSKLFFIKLCNFRLNNLLPVLFQLFFPCTLTHFSHLPNPRMYFRAEPPKILLEFKMKSPSNVWLFYTWDCNSIFVERILDKAKIKFCNVICVQFAWWKMKVVKINFFVKIKYFSLISDLEIYLQNLKIHTVVQSIRIMKSYHSTYNMWMCLFRNMVIKS